MPYSHKRSPEAKLRREERRKQHEELLAQQRIARWLINGTKHTDDLKKETVATLTTEDVYDYIVACVGEPHPRCAPQQLDGTILHSQIGDGLYDLAGS